MLANEALLQHHAAERNFNLNSYNYYIYQIWPAACGDTSANDMLRETQRTLPYLYSNMRIMSTLGIIPGSGCHFVLDGYMQFSVLISPLVEQDIYGLLPASPITAPDLKNAYFTTPAHDEIALEFGQNMVWNNVSTYHFYLDGVSGKVASGTVSGNVIKLQLTAASAAQTISYLQGGGWDYNQANLLYGSNGIAALTFASVPLTAQVNTAPLPPTGLGATPLDDSVSLGWSASSGATGYNVKRSTTSGSGYATVGTSSGISYSDATVVNGTTYYYVVAATNSSGASANSTQVSATPVGAVATTTTLTTSSTPSTYGNSVTLTATVIPTPPGGTVQFYDNAMALGSPVAVNTGNGQAQHVTSSLAVGSHPITATYSATTGYSGSTASPMSQTVNPVGQTISFGALSPRTYGDAPFDLAATASSGLTVSYTSSDPTVASVSSGTVTILKAGSTTITASQSGNGNYGAAVPVDQALTVNKATPLYKAPTGGGAMVTLVINARNPGAPAAPVSGPAGSAANWNYPNSAITDNYQDATGTGLVDSAGAATGVGFNLHLPLNDPWGSPALEMLKTGVYNPGYPDWGQCEINGLTPGHSYNLYIASARINNNERSKGTFRTTNPADNQTAAVDCSKDPSTGETWSANSGGPRNGTTWVEGNNFVAFRNVIANGTGKILFTANEDMAPHLVINGFQLVSAGGALPEATPIAYGQPLSSSTLGGSFVNAAGATVPGSLAFTTPSAKPNAGTNSESVTFTPADPTKYATVTTNVSVTVTPVSLSITATDQSKAYGATVLFAAGSTLFTSIGLQNGDVIDSVTLACAGGGASTPVSGSPFTITPSEAIGVTFRAANYNITPVTGTLTVIKATPVITWANPAPIQVGTPLSAMQLNASSGGVTGAFDYTPPGGTVLLVGNGQPLSVQFSPSDTDNYNTPAVKVVALDVTASSLPTPILETIVRTNDVLTLKGTTDVPGKLVVERKLNLLSTDWVSIQTNDVPGASFSIPVTRDAAEKSFYRVGGTR